MSSSQELLHRFARVSNYDHWSFEAIQKHKTASCMPRAAVLVSFIFKSGTWKILLTIRSAKLRTEPNTVSFPGGMAEEGESEVETALREANEEIGLERHQITVIGNMPPIINRSGKLVCPVVGLITDQNFDPKPNEEVDKVFYLPAERFLSSVDHSIKYPVMLGNVDYAVHFFYDTIDASEETVTTYGLTAHLAICASIVVCNKLPEFEIHPKFNSLSINDPYIWLRTIAKNFNDIIGPQTNVSKL
ncbi:DgyrCDS222 [Dimorphilus gyrociliatus]|uniref:DgyrCDS222 n=1 Tax=Dimorphilus gyrociliatus TaxID=2664684 RepID=A0A7I8V8B5_9ANNE|nr:DgyrCDS222 [Dimorphilus gyrociliatus]